MIAPMVTRRRWVKWTEREPVFIDWQTGHGAGPGGTFTMRPAATLPDFLAELPDTAQRVFVVGPRPEYTPDGFRSWMTDPGAGWATASEGHYLEDADGFTLRFEGPEGRRVSVVRAAVWFGEGDYSPVKALAAWGLLRVGIADHFDGGTLLATPASTGRDLFVRGLGEKVFHLASPEHQALIRSTTGQGRDELLPPAVPALSDGLAEYDGRFMYAACAWGLGSGVEYDNLATGPTTEAAFISQFLDNPYRRGRYQIRWTVPARWDHVGLVGLWTDDGWRYPSAPGDSGVSWVDGSELALLVRYRWSVSIKRRLLLYQPDGPGPLDRWAKKLIALRAELLAFDPGPFGDPYGLAAAAVRSILLHAVGAFTGARHVVTRTAPLDQPGLVPRDAMNMRVEGETIVWGEAGPARWPEVSHPEWSAAIWARCRARMLSGPGGTGALHVSGSAVVAFRTDALYLAERPDWHDDGKAGRLRLVAHLPGPVPWPASKRELLSMKARAS